MKEICPLLSIGKMNPQGFPTTVPCPKEDCQWWIDNWETCAIYDMACSLDAICMQYVNEDES